MNDLEQKKIQFIGSENCMGQTGDLVLIKSFNSQGLDQPVHLFSLDIASTVCIHKTWK